MGDSLWAQLRSGLEQKPPASIRLNPLKTVGRWTCHGDSIPWCAGGRYLAGRPAFTFDPLLHAGLYYVQEASSMFLSHVLRTFVKEPVMMLDLCAAPGGKTTCAASALPEGSELWSNEPDRRRAAVLAENVVKYGAPFVTVTNNVAADYASAGMQFDVVLTDVPCSGEGMFRKDSGAIAEWSTEKVASCAALQRSILADIWPCLRPGGLLIYSTCTFNAHEDEENVEWIARELGADVLEIPVESSWHITGSLSGSIPVCRFLPGVSRGEGLFMAALRKRRAGSEAPKAHGKSHGLHVIAGGVGEPQRKCKNVIPDVSQALMISSKRGEYPFVDTDYSTAIAYLRREAVTLPADAPRGIVTVCYRGEPLGYAKNIGNRANNLYPQEWRIKSTHLPAEIPEVLIEAAPSGTVR